MKFSALILAGGKSSRMGKDKAWLEFQGRTLISRQVELVQSLQPMELFISGRAGVDYRALHCEVLLDEVEEKGPLAGIAKGLKTTAAELLLVLAVDMPGMDATMLHRLLSECAEGRGVVPRFALGIEPLAAVYPKSAASAAERLLETDQCSVRGFAERCVEMQLAQFLDLSEEERAKFENWNCPTDVDESPQADGGE